MMICPLYYWNILIFFILSTMAPLAESHYFVKKKQKNKTSQGNIRTESATEFSYKASFKTLIEGMLITHLIHIQPI